MLGILEQLKMKLQCLQNPCHMNADILVDSEGSHDDV
jgi:hypothetical protein